MVLKQPPNFRDQWTLNSTTLSTRVMADLIQINSEQQNEEQQADSISSTKEKQVIEFLGSLPSVSRLSYNKPHHQAGTTEAGHEKEEGELDNNKRRQRKNIVAKGKVEEEKGGGKKEEDLRGFSEDLVELAVSEALERARQRLATKRATLSETRSEQQVSSKNQPQEEQQVVIGELLCETMTNGIATEEETRDLTTQQQQQQQQKAPSIKRNINESNNNNEENIITVDQKQQGNEEAPANGEQEKDINQEKEMDATRLLHEQSVALTNSVCNSPLSSSSGNNSSTNLSNVCCSRGNHETDEEHLDSDEDEFCAEAASESTLRRIRMNTFEDVLICEQNRHSMQFARQIFRELSQKTEEQEHNYKQQNYSSLSLKSSNNNNANRNKRSGSLASTGSSELEGVSPVSSTLLGKEREGMDQLFTPSCPDEFENSIKLVRRVNSSTSSASNALNFRQTLVCSVSPISGLATGTGELSVNNSYSSQENMSLEQQQQACPSHPLYPIDGTEIEQCRAAFRENKRLIEEQQKLLQLKDQQQANLANNTTRPRPASCPLNSHWIDKFRRESILNSREQICSHCKQRLYPVDKMELDFTKTTLEIHRNCFKCEICSTLLRLETYAALNAKLYCPAHIKCVTPSR